MFISESEKLIREYFDISDERTRKMILAEDGNDTQLLTALTNALYDKIVGNVDKIDFGSIPRSRGDITKVEGFENTLECINIIRKIVVEYKQDTVIVDNVLGAIDNIKTRKAQFIKAYATNTEFPMVLYNLITLAIEQTVSFLIATTIQFIKDPETGSFGAALDKIAYNNTRDNLLYEQLEKFNSGCASGQIDTAISEVYKAKVYKEALELAKAADDKITITISAPADAVEDEVPDTTEQKPEELFGDEEEPGSVEPTQAVNGCDPIASNVTRAINGCGNPGNTPMGVSDVQEGIVGDLVYGGAKIIGYTIMGIKAILGCVIPLLRSITYFFIHSRVKVSDALAIQAQFLEANANQLKYSDDNMDEDRKKKVIARQLKIAEKLRTWSNRLSIDSKKAQKEAERDTENEKRKTKAEDIEDQLPDDMNSDDIF
jgi:hypothetical protein